MDFSSDANANFEGLLAVNREICMPQMAEKTSTDAPPNCAVVPLFSFLFYPFKPLVAMPSMKYFCKQRNTTDTGSSDTSDAAMIR